MESVGSRLSQARIARGMTLEDVAQLTKISRTTLAAIEEGRQEVLPAPVYTRGFIRAYAGVVGLDGRELLRDAVEPSATTESSRPAALRRQPTSRRTADAPPRFAHLMGIDEHPRTRGLRGSHILLFLVALGMFLTAWFTVGARSMTPETAEGPVPAIQERVDGVSSYTSADAQRE